jgi:hypothetical protein
VSLSERLIQAGAACDLREAPRQGLNERRSRLQKASQAPAMAQCRDRTPDDTDLLSSMRAQEDERRSGVMIREHCSPSADCLWGLIGGIVSVRQAFECQFARNDDIPPRASQESRAIGIGLSFENRHHVDKTFERIECENRVKETGFSVPCRSFEKGERGVISAFRRGHDYPDRTLENRASSRCLRPCHENTDFLLAFSHPADETLLGFIKVSG